MLRREYICLYAGYFHSVPYLVVSRVISVVSGLALAARLGARIGIAARIDLAAKYNMRGGGGQSAAPNGANSGMV